MNRTNHSREHAEKIEEKDRDKKETREDNRKPDMRIAGCRAEDGRDQVSEGLRVGAWQVGKQN